MPRVPVTGFGPGRSSGGVPMVDTNSLELLDREDLIKMITSMVNGGVFINFHGKRSAMEIARRVRPRVTRRVKELHVGPAEEQCRNLLIEGENLQAMVTLYKYRGQVDLILTDPPYNTGGQFRYNDKWDEDPNDPDLGQLVAFDDGSRHTKWMKAMMPRLQMMKAMLKPSGVIAICIDDNELFHLGMMMDEVFGEENRLAIINWQKAYSPKNSNRHVSSATEYVLVYAANRQLAKTGLLPRTDEMNARYRNPDNDPQGSWKSTDLSSTDIDKTHGSLIYGIQSPFTGEILYPTEGRFWSLGRKPMKKALEEWGTEYVEKKLGDGLGPALVLKGDWRKARTKAEAILGRGAWPKIFFQDDGKGRPASKTYLEHVKRGMVPQTFWVEEDYESPLEIGTMSWKHEESGHSQAGINELAALVGEGHNFSTVKPLKLMKKIIQLWCPTEGLVLDTYAGSGTTGHAVLELNHQAGARRRFILIEQGRPENGDKYARTLMWQRIHNAITGYRPNRNGKMQLSAEPLGGGFEFRMLTTQIDAKTVMSMKRDELIDVVITSHWDTDRRHSPNLQRIDDPRFTYLVGKNEQNEGYFIIWRGDGPVGQLDITSYREVLAEGKRAGLKTPYHVYARYEIYQSKNVIFYKIPDKILAHLGLNEASDRYNDAEVAEA